MSPGQLAFYYINSVAEYAFDAAEKYVGGDTELGEKKVYLDSHLVEKEEAEKTLSDWQ